MHGRTICWVFQFGAGIEAQFLNLIVYLCLWCTLSILSILKTHLNLPFLGSRIENGSCVNGVVPMNVNICRGVVDSNPTGVKCPRDISLNRLCRYVPPRRICFFNWFWSESLRVWFSLGSVSTGYFVYKELFSSSILVNVKKCLRKR